MLERTAHQSLKGYELTERIGSGDFGSVYRAYQYTVGREVAIKIILPGFANQPDFIRRFEMEAQQVTRLEHLHIVPLYNYWRDPGGAYLVMRWLRGGNLKELLQNNPLDLASTLKLFTQIAAGLAAAHRKEIVHRNLKPTNILLDEEGNGYLSDFCIACNLDQPSGSLEALAESVGFPVYLSPEQIRGELVSIQSDIYTLGVLLYEMLSGAHPFAGLTPLEQLNRHLNDRLPFIKNLPAEVQKGVNAVIQKATEKTPRHRYRDALEMAAALNQAASPVERETEAACAEQLTLREAEILGLIVAGYSNKQIAQELFVELSTIKWHITQIYAKLQVRTRYQAILRAREMQLIFPAQERADGEIYLEPSEEGTLDLSGLGLINPYKGLRPFESADSRDFYGREVLIEKLVGRMAESHPYSRFLAVVGPSGCGKSSLVKAGLIPALRNGALPGSDRWFIVEMEPGSRPLDELEIALTRVAADNTVDIRALLEQDETGLWRAAGLILPPDDSQLLICIDQFEALFSLVQVEARRSQFLNLLTTAISNPQSRVRILVTLRADYYDRPLQYPAFGELVRCRMETVLPLNAREMERAILLPAQKVGVKFEPGLAASIIEEFHYQPGALPLLQYALTELFDRREEGWLTRRAYQALGGAVGALAKRAEELYQQLDSASQGAARQAFLQLVALGDVEDGNPVLSDTRRRVVRGDLLASAADPETLDELIDAYAAYRLLTLDIDPESHQPTVALAHEALIREWERLRLWIEDSREDLLQHRRLGALASEWQAAGQDSAYLLRQSRLDHFSAWAEGTDLGLSSQEKAFLDASQAERQARRAVEVDRQRREAVRERRKRNVLRALVVLFFLIALGSLATVWTVRKQASLTTSRVLAGAAIENLETDPELSILLSLQALRTAYTREAEDALHRALPASRVRLTLSGHTNGASSVEFSPDGKNIATASNAGEVTIWETSRGQKLFGLPGSIARYSPDGARLATGSLDGALTLWDSATGDQIWTEKGHKQRVFELVFSPDGKLLVSASQDNTFKVWDTETGGEVFSSPDPPSGSSVLLKVAFSPDGRRLISADYHGPDRIAMQVWEADEDWGLLNQFSGYRDLAFSPDGRWLAARGGEIGAGVVLWELAKLSGTDLAALDLSAEEPILIPAKGDTTILDFAFSPEGSRLYSDFGSEEAILATGNQDGSVDVWRISPHGQHLLMTLSGHTNEVVDVAFNPDVSRLATASADGSVRIWDITPEGAAEWFTLKAHEGEIPSIDLTADGKYLATASYDGVAKVWDLASRQELLAIREHGAPLAAVAISSDGSRLATGGYDTIVKIWGLNLSPGAPTYKLLHTLHGHSPGLPVFRGYTGITGLAFSPDGTQLVTGGVDGMAKIWDVSTGQELLSIQAHPEQLGIIGMDLSPDGRLLGTASNATSDGRNALAKIWDVESGEEISTFSGHVQSEGILSLAFSPDGKRVATGSWLNSLIIWEARTGKELQKLVDVPGAIVSIDFSPDGKFIVAAIPKGYSKIWDATSGQSLQIFTNTHEFGPLFHIVFTPDGKKVIASSFRFIYGYVFDTQELIDLAYSRLSRWFTLDECRKYLHQEQCPQR